MRSKPIRAERGVDQKIRRVIPSPACHSGVPPKSCRGTTLFAGEEPLITSSCGRPNKRIAEVETDGIRKKLNDKVFACCVSDGIPSAARPSWEGPVGPRARRL